MASGGSAGVNWNQAGNIIPLLDNISEQHFISLAGFMYQQRAVTNVINYNGPCNEKVPAARVNAQIDSRSDECLWKAVQKVN